MSTNKIAPSGVMERTCCVAMMSACEEVVTLLSGLGEVIRTAELGDRATAMGPRFEASAEAMRGLLRTVAGNLAMTDRELPDREDDPTTPTERAVFLRGLRSALDEDPDTGLWVLTRGGILALLTMIDETTE